MKKSILSLLPFFLLVFSSQTMQGQCHASFTWEQIPGSLQVHFHSTSTSEHDIVSYHWNFGDGHEGHGSNPYHTYAEPGTYVVCLIIMDNAGCASDVCHEVHVGATGGFQSNFSIDIDDEGIVSFINASTGTNEHTVWFWDFGDGSSSNAQHPQHGYNVAGEYTVCLIITDTMEQRADTFCLTAEFPEGMISTVHSIDDAFKSIWYTNPVSDELVIHYEMKQGAVKWLELYTLQGKRIKLQQLSPDGSGLRTGAFDMHDVPGGLYILVLRHGAGLASGIVSVIR